MRRALILVAIIGVIAAIAYYLLVEAQPMTVQYSHQTRELVIGQSEPLFLQEYDTSQMPFFTAMKLRALVKSSGILAPDALSKFSLSMPGQANNPENFSPISGTYVLTVVRPWRKEPDVRVLWVSNHAPDSVWPLVHFLQENSPTGKSEAQPMRPIQRIKPGQ
jgi:hypothetical protein